MAKKLNELKKQYFKLAPGVESFSDPLQESASGTLIKGEVKELRLTPRVREFLKGGALEQAEEQDAIEYRKRLKAQQGGGEGKKGGGRSKSANMVSFTAAQQQQIADALVETIHSARAAAAAPADQPDENPSAQQEGNETKAEETEESGKSGKDAASTVDSARDKKSAK